MLFFVSRVYFGFVGLSDVVIMAGDAANCYCVTLGRVWFVLMFGKNSEIGVLELRSANSIGCVHNLY